MTQFNDLRASAQKLIELEGFQEPTAIQAAVIPVALKGRDLIGISETGTGKTHAFLIPLMEKINPELPQVQAVITAPTRELAMQIYNRAKTMTQADPRLRVRLITGGLDREKMADSVKTQPHLVIGTPGRIKDLFLDQEVLRVDTASVLVVDEADMTLEFGFLEDIDAIASRMGESFTDDGVQRDDSAGPETFLKEVYADAADDQNRAGNENGSEDRTYPGSVQASQLCGNAAADFTGLYAVCLPDLRQYPGRSGRDGQRFARGGCAGDRNPTAACSRASASAGDEAAGTGGSQLHRGNRHRGARN